jgi:hypothetical protein
MNIHNFVNRNMCEYALLYPTVASLLDHLLFTVGNGYDFDEDTGMICYGHKRIDQYPKITKTGWKKLIAEGHAKERRWAEDFKRFGDTSPIDEVRLAEECEKYKICEVDDSMFTEDALYAELVATQELRNKERFGDRYLRPYPLSEKYSDVYNLNTNTPTWFVQIALNFCRAWVRFLNEELAAGHVWIKPSLRKKTEEQLAFEKFAEEVVDEILGGDAGTPYVEPESDYADLSWTTRHRDALVEQVQRLEGLINA